MEGLLACLLVLDVCIVGIARLFILVQEQIDWLRCPGLAMNDVLPSPEIYTRVEKKRFTMLAPTSAIVFSTTVPQIKGAAILY